MKTFGSAILMLYHFATGKEISLDELWRENELAEMEISGVKEQLSEVIFRHQEGDLPHNPYDQEKREMDSIRKGDKDIKKRRISK